MNEIEQLKHRLLMVQDDSKCLWDFIVDKNLGSIFEEEGGAMPMANSGATFINNIDIACNLNDSECLGWKAVYGTIKAPVVIDPRVTEVIKSLKDLQVDGETMQYIIEEVGMDDQMHRQLVMTKDALDTSVLLKEKIDLEVRK
jgi:hypothetical protein